MNRELYIHTLQGMRDVFAHEHMDTQVESLDVAIWAIETQEQLQKERDAALAMAKMEMFIDGTLSVTVDAVTAIKALPSAQPEPQWIPCSECINYIDERCVVANHHVSEKENCMEVFGAKRRTVQGGS